MGKKKEKEKEIGGGLLDITNADPPNENNHRNPDPRLPQHPGRVCIIGGSGSGKTNLMINLLSKGWLEYDKLILALKNPDQPAWNKFIEQVTEEITELGEPPEEFLTVISNIDDIPPIESLPGGDIQTVLVIDDFVAESKLINDIIGKYWIRSRHKNVSAYYLSQSFYMTPRIVRLNSTYFILFGNIPLSELGRLYKEIAPGISRDEFVNYYYESTSAPRGFLFIDLLNPSIKKRFRSGFDGVFE